MNKTFKLLSITGLALALFASVDSFAAPKGGADNVRNAQAVSKYRQIISGYALNKPVWVTQNAARTFGAEAAEGHRASGGTLVANEAQVTSKQNSIKLLGNLSRDLNAQSKGLGSFVSKVLENHRNDPDAAWAIVTKVMNSDDAVLARLASDGDYRDAVTALTKHYFSEGFSLSAAKATAENVRNNLSEVLTNVQSPESLRQLVGVNMKTMRELQPLLNAERGAEIKIEAQIRKLIADRKAGKVSDADYKTKMAALQKQKSEATLAGVNKLLSLVDKTNTTEVARLNAIRDAHLTQRTENRNATISMLNKAAESAKDSELKKMYRDAADHLLSVKPEDFDARALRDGSAESRAAFGAIFDNVTRERLRKAGLTDEEITYLTKHCGVRLSA